MGDDTSRMPAHGSTYYNSMYMHVTFCWHEPTVYLYSMSFPCFLISFYCLYKKSSWSTIPWLVYQHVYLQCDHASAISYQLFHIFQQLWKDPFMIHHLIQPILLIWWQLVLNKQDHRVRAICHKFIITQAAGTCTAKWHQPTVCAN